MGKSVGHHFLCMNSKSFVKLEPINPSNQKQELKISCPCLQALGCLLFRICYFKNAFDGESKLQILNGNYRIPELPKYSSFITDLIRDMLQASPDDRPDITQASALLDWPFISMNLGQFQIDIPMPLLCAGILTFCLLMLGFSSHGDRCGFVLMSSYLLGYRSHCLIDHLKCNLLVMKVSTDFYHASKLHLQACRQTSFSVMNSLI